MYTDHTNNETGWTMNLQQAKQAIEEIAQQLERSLDREILDEMGAGSFRELALDAFKEESPKAYEKFSGEL